MINKGAGAQIVPPKSPGLSPGVRASESEAEPSSQGFCGLGLSLAFAGSARAQPGLEPKPGRHYSYVAEPSEIEGILPDAMLRTNGHGSITVNFSIGAKTNTVKLCDAKHVPDVPNNLISVGRVSDKDNMATFTGTDVEFKTWARVIFAQGQKSGHLYKMKVQVTRSNRSPDFAAAPKGHSINKWHRILGHINTNSIRMLKNNNLVTGLEIDESQELNQCKACIQGKRHVEPFPKRAEDSVDKVGDLTVSDVWGPAQTEGTAHEQYFFHSWTPNPDIR
jgi:GAG-pre-integrase domain